MVDPYLPWVAPTECRNAPREGVKAFRAWVLEHFGGEGVGIARACTPGAPVDSLHHEGRAWDWGIVRKPAQVEKLIAFLLADGPEGDPHYWARRFGIVTIIYKRRIWSTGNVLARGIADGWRDYNGTSPHVDHVHFGFHALGADGETSGYRRHLETGRVSVEVPALGGVGGVVGPCSGRPCVPPPPSTQPDAAGPESDIYYELGPLLPSVPGLEDCPQRFRWELWRQATAAGFEAAWIAAVMSFETAGTFDPTVRNRWSTAVGLVQWTTIAAAAQQTTVAEIAKLSRLEQLELAIDRFKLASNIAPLVTLADYYMAVFAPAFVGAPSSARMYTRPRAAYRYNERLDVNEDGIITKDEAARPIQALLDDAATRPPLSAHEPTE